MARRSRMAARRRELKRTQAKIAAACGASLRQVKRWEAGVSDPYDRQHEAIASERAYDWPLDRIGELLARDGEPQVVTTDSVDDVDRRDLIAALGGAFAGTLVGSAPARASGRDVPPELAGYFADQLTAHHSADVRHGVEPLLNTVVSEHGAIRGAANVARGETRAALLGVNVGYANLVGWLHEDAGDLARAWQWHGTALELAHQTGAPHMVAYALANLAYLRVDAGDAPGAVDLANGVMTTPGLRGEARRYVLRDLAGTCALAGETDALDRTLAEQDDVTGDDDGYPWSVANIGMSAAYVDACRATSYGQSGRVAQAVELWPSVLGEYAPDAYRSRGVYATRYAAALLDVEGPDAALGPATEAVSCLQNAPSARMRRELTQLRERAADRLDLPAGRDLRDVLQTVA